ncbi:MAG: hypothetical protein R3B13_09260 [Polyangiaceae bacterium]
MLRAWLVAICVGVCGCSVVNQLDELKGGTDAGADASGGTDGGGAASGVLPTGALCATDESCKTGFCVSGMCCDARCDAPCMACTAAAKESGELDGACGPAKDGTDPQSDCADQGADTCGTDGKCDGKGGCRVYTNGTRCSDATCQNGIKTLPKTCDGKGACIELGQTICNPMQCNGNLCQGDCETDAACQTTEFCDVITNRCADKLPNGTTCSDAKMCQSAFCVDGVCCESTCASVCRACAAALTTGKDGECAPILDGTDPKGQCEDQGATGCGTDGQCDGQGACRLYGNTAVCAGATCSGSTLTAAKTCDGMGNCASNGSTSCIPYLCGSGACLTSCSDSTQCDGTTQCIANQCQGQKSNGSSCGGSTECLSGFCVDGVCCNSACTGKCQACSTAKKGTGANGTCGNVAAGLDPHSDCSATSSSSCGQDGQCNGNGGCRLWAAGTQCGAPSCAIDPANNVTYLAQYADTCDGAGQCVDKGTQACGLYKCAGTACGTQCASNSDCALGVCNTTAGTCYFSCSLRTGRAPTYGGWALLSVLLISAGASRRRRRPPVR